VPHTRHDMLAAGTAHHLTYRQLDFWTRRGHLHLHGGPCGSGHTQQWADGEHLIAATMARLTNAGLTVAAAARAARGHTHLAPGVSLLILPETPLPAGAHWCTMRDGRIVTDTDADLEQMAAAS
jgi:hypothetical protein